MANQNKRKIIVVAIVVAVLVVGVVAFAVTNQSSKTDTKTSSSQEPQQIITANVAITAASVSPATVEIKKGQSVTWKNDDTKDHQIAADPYPTNSSLPDLGKSVVLKPGDTFTYIYESAGSFSYHDNLDPYKIKGVVVVKE
jgi:plastocyanin